MSLFRTRRQSVAVLTSVFALMLPTLGHSQEIKSATKFGDMSSVTQDLLTHAASDSSNFLHANGDYGQQRFYPNSQINTTNVSKLRPAWIFQTEVKESLETSPIVVNGIMYVTTSFSHVYALERAHRRRAVALTHHKMGPITTFCCGPNNRGVAVADNLVYRRERSTAQLVALDAKHRQDVVWKTEVADPELGYSETMAPTVVKGKVLIGTNGGEYGIRGFMKAFDAKTGKLIWTFRHHPGELDPWVSGPRRTSTGRVHASRHRSREGCARQDRRPLTRRSGGGVWQNPCGRSRDEPDLFRGGQSLARSRRLRLRPGDNLYTDSLVSLDLDTGKYVCHLSSICPA